ncbi:TetR/AcrR family transcriptional regulator [Streptomyces canus]|uniref:TetR/AcrR family transcriptional regulator n=1 Tax=Streptomyces canus TaxID=58343 RepID=UPI00037EC106|nr:TetR/AcrR family transcriptional regulator [Streptomyces canus]
MESLSLRERKQQRARQRIVDAAWALFAERGFVAVSVADIAERAEVGRTTFFRYFGDKQEVLFADEEVLLAAIRAAPREQETATEVPDAIWQLWKIAESIGGLMFGDPALWALRSRLLADNPELRDRAARKLDRIADALTDVLCDCGTDPDVARTAAEVGVGCFRAAQLIAGENPAGVMPAMREAVTRVLASRFHEVGSPSVDQKHEGCP